MTKRPIQIGSPEYAEVHTTLTHEFTGDSMAADICMSKYLHHDKDNLYEHSLSDMHERWVNEFDRIESQFEEQTGKRVLSKERLAYLLEPFKRFVLGGSPMAGIGLGGYTSMSNCYVIGNDADSYGGIFKTDEEQVQLMKRRGGVGHDLSHIRPEGVEVHNSAITTSGVVSFMERFSTSTKEVAQNGRRGALMLSLSIEHPDADKFIDAKKDLTKITGANISIKLTDAFMRAVLAEQQFEHIWRGSDGQELHKTSDAKALFDKIVDNVWASAEPGVFFWDRIMEESNSKAYGKMYEERSTNPCIVGSTKVMLADGRQTMTIRELADIGDDVNVYCYDDNNNVVVRKMRHPRKTGSNVQIYKVTLDSGDVIRCTGNHKFKLTDGTYKEARQLQHGDSLAIIARQQCSFDEVLSYQTNSKSAPYYAVLNNGVYKFEHRLIAEYCHAEQFDATHTVVHHIDGNSLNNDPNNLQVLSKKEHDALHALERRGTNNPIYKIKANAERFAQYSAKMSASTSGERNGRYDIDTTVQSIVDYVTQCTAKVGRGLSRKELEYYMRYAPGNNTVAWSGYRYNKLVETFGSIDAFLSHCATRANVKYPDLVGIDSRCIATAIKVRNMGYDTKFVDKQVYVKRICEHCGSEFWAHWFYREVAYCSAECGHAAQQAKWSKEQVLVYTAAKQKLGKRPNYEEFANECKSNNVDAAIHASYRKFKQFADYYNHRVHTVELDGVEDVYNGTVDDYHNFFVGSFDAVNDTNDRHMQVFVNNRQCGEQPLAAYASCILSHRNLTAYVLNPWTADASFDFEAFYKDTYDCAVIMDDLVQLEIEAVQRIIAKVESDKESFDIKKTELDLWHKVYDKLTNTRRYGMGFLALGDAMAMLGLRYGSQESIDFAVTMQQWLVKATYEASIDLAEIRGSFAIFDYDTDVQSKFIQRMLSELIDDEHITTYQQFGRRNINTTTIAPTGTTALMTQTTSGIEPVFMPLHKRRRKPTAVDNEADINFIDETTGDKFIEYAVVHYPLMQWICKRVQLGDDKFTLVKDTGIEWSEAEMSRIKAWLSNASQAVIDELLVQSPYYKATTEDVDWIGKVKLQGALQKYIDSSISVTVNIPNSATKELVREIYLTAWKSGCKGCTIYRDGSRAGVLVKDDKQSKDKSHVLQSGHRSKRKPVLPAAVYCVSVYKRKWCILVGCDDGRPYEIFAFELDKDEFDKLQGIEQTTITKTDKKHYKLGDNLSFLQHYDNISERLGSDEQQTITRLYSTMLRNGIDLGEIVDQTAKSFASVGTFCKAIGRALKLHIQDGSKMYAKCPECGGDMVKFDGCVRCTNCGHSACN